MAFTFTLTFALAFIFALALAECVELHGAVIRRCILPSFSVGGCATSKKSSAGERQEATFKKQRSGCPYTSEINLP